VGKRLWLRATDASVTIYQDLRLVAAHPRGRRGGERHTLRDHLPPEAQAFFAHDRDWCLQQAQRIGPACSALIEQLLSDRIVDRLRAAQALLRLKERYECARVEAACARALYHASPYYRTVKSISGSGFDAQPLPEQHADTPTLYASARFARAAGDLFDPPSHLSSPGAS
jgi:hypothetical protein